MYVRAAVFTACALFMAMQAPAVVAQAIPYPLSLGTNASYCANVPAVANAKWQQDLAELELDKLDVQLRAILSTECQATNLQLAACALDGNSYTNNSVSLVLQEGCCTAMCSVAINSVSETCKNQYIQALCKPALSKYKDPINNLFRRCVSGQLLTCPSNSAASASFKVMIGVIAMFAAIMLM